MKLMKGSPTKIKIILRVTLFTVLLFLFYFMYMKHALEQYKKGSTTIVKRQEFMENLEPPILIVCPEPPFKPSFFKEKNIIGIGSEKYFWLQPIYHKQFENDSSTAQDLYENMSYNLQSDWNITLVQTKG